jgi:hypothetical protein
MEQQVLLETEQRNTLGLAYGLGVDSTAIIVGFVMKGIRPDFILFADVGAEKESTYAYLPIIQQYLKENNFPPVTVVKYEPKFSPYTTIEGNMVMNATLPGATFGRGSCTVKWKIKPQEKWEKQNVKGTITKAIGFEAGEEYRQLRANDKAHAGSGGRTDCYYPLIQWGWDRDECKARIEEAGLPVPPKSACIFCPNMKPHELDGLTEEELGRIVRVEVMAEPYNRKVEGLWRRRRKIDDRAGSITEYLVENDIPFTHPDELEFMPLNPACNKGKRGFTFNEPHNEVRLTDLIGGCNCAAMENHQHLQIIKSLF